MKRTHQTYLQDAARIFRVKSGRGSEADRTETTVAEAEKYLPAETFDHFMERNGIQPVEEIFR